MAEVPVDGVATGALADAVATADAEVCDSNDAHNTCGDNSCDNACNGVQDNAYGGVHDNVLDNHARVDDDLYKAETKEPLMMQWAC